MRVVAALAASLVLTAPAAAQGLPRGESAGLWMELNMQRQRDVALQNQLTALEMQVRTDQAAAALGRQALSPRISSAPVPAGGLGGAQPIAQAAAVPEDRLAASNARILAASANRR